MDTNIVTPDVTLQWTKGDKVGNVEKVENQDGEWTVFQSGARIATSLINEFMIPIEGEPLDLNASLGINTPSDFHLHNSQGNHTTEIQRSVKPTKDNPIKTLFDKQKKTDQINLELSIPINVPLIDIFNIISMSFDEEEVLKELDSFISNQVNVENIKDTLQKSIHELIVERYNI
jgi:hypothetical protein